MGALLGYVAVVTKNEILLIVIGGIFVFENDIGHNSGDIVQAHRKKDFQDGPDSPPF